MKQEDKQFLAELAKELNTQDNAATRNPIWCIMDKETIIVPEGDEDFMLVVGPEICMPLEDFVEYIINEVPEVLQEQAEEDFSLCDNIDELREALETYTSEDPYSYNMYNAGKEERICRDATGFLTKKSAEEHLKINAHHYSDEARVYALSAWRNPVYEKLIKIIKTTNWEEI